MATLEQYSQVVVSFAMIGIMSRLLDSNEIGIAVVGLGIGTIAFNFREFVTSEYLIQRDSVSRDDIRTAFTLMFSFSVFVGCTLWVLAPSIASSYSRPGLVGFIRILAVAGVIDAAMCTIAALLRRDMEFGKVTRINALGALSNAVVAIGLASFGFGYVSFAWAALAMASVRLMLGFHARPVFWMYRPRFAGWRTVLRFSGFKGASTVLDRTYETVPQLVLGRFMPLTQVGIFNRANIVCGLPDKLFLGALFNVAYPAFASEARAQRDLKGAYLRIISYITALYWPSMLGIAVLAHPIVNLALGSDWSEAVPILRLLAISSMFFFPHILTYPVLCALGANKDVFTSNFIGRGISIVIICAASYFGLYALVLSQFIVQPFQMITALIYVRRHVPFGWGELLAVLRKSGCVALAALFGPLAMVAANDFNLQITVLQTCFAIILSGMGWLAALALTQHPFFDELTRIGNLVLPRLMPARTKMPAE
jgi:O-antigen/teichoic acid export membrane protein